MILILRFSKLRFCTRCSYLPAIFVSLPLRFFLSSSRSLVFVIVWHFSETTRIVIWPALIPLLETYTRILLIFRSLDFSSLSVQTPFLVSCCLISSWCPFDTFYIIYILPLWSSLLPRFPCLRYKLSFYELLKWS